MSDNLYLAEIFYDTGEIKFRYSRILSADKTRWIRHGLFREYHKNGQIISEGMYENGEESGLWHDYYENGNLAAKGNYKGGVEVGEWKYWDLNGEEIKSR